MKKIVILFVGFSKSFYNLNRIDYIITIIKVKGFFNIYFIFFKYFYLTSKKIVILSFYLSFISISIVKMALSFKLGNKKTKYSEGFITNNKQKLQKRSK